LQQSFFWCEYHIKQFFLADTLSCMNLLEDALTNRVTPRICINTDEYIRVRGAACTNGYVRGRGVAPERFDYVCGSFSDRQIWLHRSVWSRAHSLTHTLVRTVRWTGTTCMERLGSTGPIDRVDPSQAHGSCRLHAAQHNCSLAGRCHTTGSNKQTKKTRLSLQPCQIANQMSYVAS
jgi:hypothetical protein